MTETRVEIVEEGTNIAEVSCMELELLKTGNLVGVVERVDAHNDGSFLICRR